MWGDSPWQVTGNSREEDEPREPRARELRGRGGQRARGAQGPAGERRGARAGGQGPGAGGQEASGSEGHSVFPASVNSFLLSSRVFPGTWQHAPGQGYVHKLPGCLSLVRANTAGNSPCYSDTETGFANEVPPRQRTRTWAAP